MSGKRLYKSRTNRMIAGVCAGVAEYLDIDPTIVRLLWVLSIFLGGSGILLYIAGMIIMPPNPKQEIQSTVVKGSKSIWAFLLIGLGVVLLLDNLDLFPFFHWWNPFSWKLITAILLIAIGIVLLMLYYRGSSVAHHETASTQQTPRRLYRSVRDRKILGVCGGIAEYFGIDSTIVRLVFVLLVFSSFGFLLLVYLLFGIIVSEEQFTTTSA